MALVEIHIPISPTAAFFNMIHCFAVSLRQNGGLFRDGRIIVSVGEDCEHFDIDEAHPELASYGIVWRWVDRTAFREHRYAATELRRWSEPFQADYVLMADADLLVAGDISAAVAALRGPRSICGVIATYPPFMARGDGNTDGERWLELFSRAALPPPVMDCIHPGYGHFYDAEMGIEFAPPYYNYGFVLGTRAAMTAIAGTLEADYRLTVEYMNTDLSEQAGLTLSIVRNNIVYACLPVRFNIWSWPRYATEFPDEFQDIRLLHYLQADIFAKPRDIESPAAIRAWLRRSDGDPEPMTQTIARLLRNVLADIEADRRNSPPLPVAQPLLPVNDSVAPYLREIDKSRIYSNFGPLCGRLEHRLANRYGLAGEHCTTGANATSLLSAALLELAGEREGCCVMPSWTFSASAHAACLAGKSPFFVDVDSQLWQLRPADVEAIMPEIGPVAAVMVVAPFGTCVDVEEWDAFTDRTGVPVVIDAAASFAAQTAARTPIVISLHATKVLGVGEGGYVCSRDAALVDSVRARLNFGFSDVRVAATRSLNGKMSEYVAAVGLAALDEWPTSERAWRTVRENYRERLDATPGVEVFGGLDISSTMIVLVEDQVAAINTLRAANIDSRLWWNRGCHREPAFSDCGSSSLATTERLAAHYVGLPISKDMTIAKIERVSHALRGRTQT